MIGIEIAKIRNSLFEWADTVSAGVIPSEQIFFREQSAPAPPRPSIGIKILSGPTRVSSFDSIIEACDSEGNPIQDEFLIAGQRTMLININTYGDVRGDTQVSFDSIIRLHSSLVSPGALSILRESGLSVLKIESINNLTEIEESEYEDRYTFDFMIGVAENFKDNLGTIETVGEIMGDLENC